MSARAGNDVVVDDPQRERGELDQVAPELVEFDLIVIGSGSGNSLIGPEMDGWRIALIERGVFGGTCLNHGCIPSKMLIYTADVADTLRHPTRFGVHGTFDHADWPAIRDRVFNRIDPISAGGRAYRHELPNVMLFEGDARFVAERVVEVNGRRITAPRIVIAAGARSFVPDVPGLAGPDAVPFHTSDTIMRVDRLPEHLVVLGGGFIGVELGYVFAALGSRATIVNRSHRLLMAEDHEISQRFTDLAADRFELVLGAHLERVERSGDGVRVVVRTMAEKYGERIHTIHGDVLLVAMGRTPNGVQLVDGTPGIATGPGEEVIVDEYGRTSADGVWALGDVNGRHQLKHMANGEAKVIAHNLLHPDELQRLDERPAPYAIFSNPQIGTIGPTEEQARATGRPICVVNQPYGHAAYGWALEDTTGFAKLIGDPVTRRLISAHIIGHEASMLVQLLVQGMHLGTTVDEIARGQVWIHPALSEVVEQALLALIDEFDRYDLSH